MYICIPIINRNPLQSKDSTWVHSLFFFSLPMAGLHTSLRPQPPSSASNHHAFAAKLLLLLTVLPLTLALFAFLLQWRGGGVDDPIGRWSPDESHKFPGMDPSPLATVGQQSSQPSDCSALVGHYNKAAFPYFRDWKYKFDADLKPKVFVLYLLFLALICFLSLFGPMRNGFYDRIVCRIVILRGFDF